MKRQFRILTVLAVIAFGLSTLAFAGESVGFSVSCTIPAIPGVNVPLNEDTKIEAQAEEEKETQTTSPDEETQEEQPVLIEEFQETQLAQGATATLTKVIYSR